GPIKGRRRSQTPFQFFDARPGTAPRGAVRLPKKAFKPRLSHGVHLLNEAKVEGLQRMGKAVFCLLFPSAKDLSLMAGKSRCSTEARNRNGNAAEERRPTLLGKTGASRLPTAKLFRPGFRGMQIRVRTGLP